MTVQQLITILQQFSPERRVLVPGRKLGMADVGEVTSRRFSFYFGADPAWGNWIPRLLRRKDLHPERGVVICASPSSARRRRPPYFEVTGVKCDTPKR
jgi:hypothetical protein